MKQLEIGQIFKKGKYQFRVIHQDSLVKTVFILEDLEEELILVKADSSQFLFLKTLKNERPIALQTHDIEFCFFLEKYLREEETNNLGWLMLNGN